MKKSGEYGIIPLEHAPARRAAADYRKKMNGMGAWLSVLIIFVFVTAFLIFLGWIDWILKCKKTAKENKLDFYATGYAILKKDGKKGTKQTILITEGLLGANADEWVFGSRFRDDAACLKEKLSDILSFHVSEYHENDFTDFIPENVETKYIVRNMAGISTSKRLPKFVNDRMICKIGFANHTDFYFCYKNTAKNAKAIARLKNIGVRLR